MTSTRGTMISRAVVSPNSKMLWIICSSDSSMTPSSSAVPTRNRISSSVTNGLLGAAWSPKRRRNTGGMALSSRFSQPSIQVTARTGPARCNASVSAWRMAIVLGVISQKISRKAVSAAVVIASALLNSASLTVSSAVNVDATITATLLRTRMVERKSPGLASICWSCWAERLPSSARCLIRSRPIDVRAVSDIAAKKARNRQIPRTRNCHHVLSESNYGARRQALLLN